MKNKNAYITFSSKNLSPSKKQAYKKFIKTIENVGFSIPYKWLKKKDSYIAEIVHTKALQAIRKAEYFIAEASINSIGVGQQITYALQQKKLTIICLKENKNNNNLTFLKGTKSTNLKFIYYKNLTDLRVQLLQLIDNMDKPIFEKFNFIITSKLKKIISKQSKKRGISQSELLRQIIEDWIQNIHSN